MKRIAVCLIALFSFGLGCVQAAETYTLSMQPLYSPEEIFNSIKPLAEYLSKELNIKVEPVVAKDFPEYEGRLKSGDISIGYTSPVIYTKNSQAQEVLATAADEKEGGQLRGVIITRQDSAIRNLADLKGKKVAIPSFSGGGGYWSQRLTLLENGVDTTKDMQLVEVPDNKHENVILAVYLGDVDAGFIREAALHSADAYVPPSQIRMLAETAAIPNWALSAHRSMPTETRRALQTALLKLKPADPALKALKVARFENLSDKAYDGLRKAVGLPVPTR